MMQSKPSRVGLPGENPAEVCFFVLLEAGKSLSLGLQTCTRLAGCVRHPTARNCTLPQIQ